MENKDTFVFTYSAKEQEEIKRIRQKYTVTETENNIERLRNLDAKVHQKPTMISLVVGIIGALILGLGMSLLMSELPTHLGFTQGVAWGIGLPCGIIGLATLSLAFPVYNQILKKEREKAAPEILRISDELMK